MKKLLTITTVIFAAFMMQSANAGGIGVKVFDIPVEKSPLERFLHYGAAPIPEFGKEEQVSHKTAVKKDIEVEKVDGIYFIKLDTELLKGKIKPHYLVHLDTAEQVIKDTKARFVVNAGFFDPKNEQTTSYLTLDGKQILDPHNNASLMNNKHLEPYLNLIFNRSEFRILQSETDKDDYIYDIAPHNAPVKKGYKILHSVQGGPALAPLLQLEEEFFVLTENGKIISRTASSLSKYPRTLIGIKDNNVYIVIAPVGAPVTLPEASDIMKKAGFEKAMAFDGGGSVSVELPEANLHIISDTDKTARKLKSFLLVTD